jgi:hypothetical protein
LPTPLVVTPPFTRLPVDSRSSTVAIGHFRRTQATRAGPPAIRVANRRHARGDRRHTELPICARPRRTERAHRTSPDERRRARTYRHICARRNRFGSFCGAIEGLRRGARSHCCGQPGGESSHVSCRWQPRPGPRMEPSSGCSESHAASCRSPTDPTSRAATRRAAPRTNRAGVRLALLALGRGKRWVVEYAGPVLDELDAAVEGSAIDHVERDVGVAVVDAF